MGTQQTTASETESPQQEWREEQERKKQREIDARLRRLSFYPNDKRPAASDLSADGYAMWGSDLEKAQSKFDESRVSWAAFEAQGQPLREAKAAREKAAQEARAQREEQERAQAREDLLKPAMAAFLAAGGTVAEWEAQAPHIEAEIRQQRAIEAATGTGLTDDQIRSQRRTMRSF